MYESFKKYRKLPYEERIRVYESEKSYISAHAENSRDYDAKIRALINALKI